MVDQNTMTIVDLCDDLLEMIKTEVTRAQQKRVNAVTTIASHWRYYVYWRNYYAFRVEIDDPYSKYWIDETTREAWEDVKADGPSPPWWGPYSTLSDWE